MRKETGLVIKQKCLSVMTIRLKVLASSYGVALLTLNAFVLLTSTTAIAQIIPLGGSPRSNLEQQLDIQLNNGIQGEERNQADVLLRAGGQAQRNGKLEEAIANWLQALNLYQQINDVEAVGVTYDYLGVAYAKLGRYQSAEDALRRRVGIARSRQDFQGQIYGLNNLGTVLLQAENIEAAQNSFTDALKISRTIKNRDGEGLSLSNLGLAASAAGNYPEAIKYYKTALSLRSFSGNPLGEANTRNNLADAYRAANVPKEALISYQSALSLAQISNDVPSQFRALRGLGQSFNAMKEHGAALNIFAQHLALAQREKNPVEELLSLRLAAKVYQITGNLGKARDFYEQALMLARALGDTQQEAFLRNDLAQVIYYRSRE